MKMKAKSILDSIKAHIDACEWENPTLKQKALDLCISIYNLYIQEGGDFYCFRTLGYKYFRKLIRTSNYVEPIKKVLINSGILEVNNSYDVKGKISKGYRFSNKVLDYKSDYTIFVALNENVKEGNIALNENVKEGNIALIESIQNQLKRITFKEGVDEWINSYKLDEKKIKVNNQITDTHINICFETKEYRYELSKAILFANNQNKDLIQYKDKGYIETKEEFLNRKSSELRLIFRKVVFDIENEIYRVSRNDTNFRLDYNFTNMKSDLFKYILFDNEPLEELDIANSQFAMLSHICNDLDDIFIELTQSGKLYSYIAEKFKIDELEAKNKMFCVAFGQVEKKQDDIRSIFPKTMEFIDGYKKKNGYKSFSNLLQISESNIMIDGLFKTLNEEGYEVFPIHDAFRIKKSDLEKVKNRIDEYFNSINFKCLLRNKKKQELRIIKYKYGNFKDVEIELTKEEVISMSEYAKKIRNKFGDVCIEHFKEFIKDEYKGTYLYLEYRKKYPMNYGDNNLVE